MQFKSWLKDNISEAVVYDELSGRLLYDKQEIPSGYAVHLTRLPEYHGFEAFNQATDRNHYTFALHPQNWQDTFSALVGPRNFYKVGYYRPKLIKTTPNTLVAEMQYVGSPQLYIDSLRALSSANITKYHMPELLIPKDEANWLENRFDAQGNWVGTGGGASGILPIANDTKRICLALRSKHVHSRIGGQVMQRECWGTLGGAIVGKMSPLQSAQEEVAEETGFHGPYLQIFPAYVFSSGNFKYYNFIGLTPHEFPFSPAGAHSWETNGIHWVEYEDLIKGIPNYGPYVMHDGLVALLNNSKSIIERIVKDKPKL